MKGEDIKHDSIEWSGVTIDYRWCHSRRRTLGITVRPDKSVSVRVPLRTPLKAVREFITLRAGWILMIRKKFSTLPVRPEQEYWNGAVFSFQGEPYHLEFAAGQRHSLHLADRFLILTAPETLDEETVRRMIGSWYRKQALEIIKERSEACHHLMLKESIPLPPISIRTMKTRWGSYSYKTGRISLNLNLIKAPQTCLDYVIIHELCHIKVRHHGPEFWRMVSQYVPEYLALRNQLKHYT
jgi:predicted metal-dependent hydrolase